MKHCVLWLIILLAATAAGQETPKLIGEIEYFGDSGIELNKVRAALPFHEKDIFSGETIAPKLETA